MGAATSNCAAKREPTKRKKSSSTSPTGAPKCAPPPPIARPKETKKQHQTRKSPNWNAGLRFCQPGVEVVGFHLGDNGELTPNHQKGGHASEKKTPKFIRRPPVQSHRPSPCRPSSKILPHNSSDHREAVPLFHLRGGFRLPPASF
jgi:hypothetical protein